MEMIDCITDVEPRMVSINEARIVVTPHPMTTQGQTSVALMLEDGEYLSAILERQGVDAGWIVELGGLQVPALMWGKTRVKHGVVIECRRAVHDGNTLRMAAFAVLAYYTGGAVVAWAGGGLTGAMVGAAAFMGGSMIINSLLPPVLPAQMSMATNSTQPTYSLSGGRNSARLWEPMSLVLGQPYVVPDLAGQPWTYFSGEDQYLTQVFHAGLNCQSVDTLRIGQTAITDYTDVVIHASGLPSTTFLSGLPSNSVDTISGALLDAPSGTGAWVTRTTSVGTIKIGIDLEMSLYGVSSSNGAYESRSVDLEVQFCSTGSNAWVDAQTGAGYQERYISGYTPSYSDSDGNSYGGDAIYAWRTIQYPSGTATYSNSSSKPLRVSISLPVASGQYDVRIRKVTANETSTSAQNTVTWTQLKSFQQDLTSYPGQALVSLNIKASGQLSGSLDQLNWIATARPAPYWNGSAWVAATNRTNGLSNPATQILQLARGIYDENGKLIAGLGWADSRIDIESIKAFSVWCTAKSFTFDAIIQTTMSHDDLFSAIAYAGMGTISWSAGKFGVQWLSDTAPIEGVINMGNIKAKSFSVAYSTTDRADEIEYGYFDRSSNNQWNSLRVLSPNVTMPNNTARLSNLGITTQAQAVLLARYAMAQNVYMAKAITFEQDLEYMTYKRGTVLALSHDMTQWGYSGRVQSSVNNLGVVTLTLDDDIPAVSPTGVISRFIGLRLAGETQYRTFTVQAFTGHTRAVTLAGYWPGDAVLPGSDGATMDALWIYDFAATPGLKVVVTSIEPGDNQGGAKVTVTPLPDEFWPYVLGGAYTPAQSRSLTGLPAISNLVANEKTTYQSSRYQHDLNLTFDVEPAAHYTEVWGSNKGGIYVLLDKIQGRSYSMQASLGDVWTFSLVPFDSIGRRGVSASVTYALQGTNLAPSAPTSFSATGGYQSINLQWVNPTDTDYWYTEIFESSSNNSESSVSFAKISGNAFTRPGLSSNTSMFYWLKAVDYAGNVSVFSAPSTATTQAAVVTPTSIDISGFTGFSVNAAGLLSPSEATLTALVSGIISPSCSWAITGAAPSKSSSTSVVITPLNGVSNITVVLTVSGLGLTAPLTKTVIMPVVYSGQAGQAGSNGIQSAYPGIYQWTSASTPPTRPTVTSTYTWSTGGYAPPSGWSAAVPSNTTPGQYLWEIVAPLVVDATTSTSMLDWTNSSYAIRNIAYNGANGANGANGSATYLVTRAANDSSAPTSAETTSAVGRAAALGDIAVVNYNAGNASIQYRYAATGYVQQTAYMTGSLIVQNTITGDRVAANTITANNIDSRGLSIRDANGVVILAAGTPLAAANVSGLGALATANSVSASQVSGLGALATKSQVNWSGDIANIPAFGNFAYLSGITSANIGSYIQGAAIGTAYISNAAITSALIANAAVDTLRIAGQAVTVPVGAELLNDITVAQVSYLTQDISYWTKVFDVTMDTGGQPVFVLANTVTSISNPNSVLFAACKLSLYVNGVQVARYSNFDKSSTPGVPTISTKVMSAFVQNPGVGAFNIRLYASSDVNSFGSVLCANTGVLLASGGTSLFAIGTKR